MINISYMALRSGGVNAASAPREAAAGTQHKGGGGRNTSESCHHKF
jgi:hypothetical protein